MKYERRVIERNTMKKLQQKKAILKQKNNMLQGQNYNKEVFKKVFNKGPNV